MVETLRADSFGARVVALLVRKQAELGLSDVAMSGRLGVSQPHWCRVRRGLAGPGERLLSAAVREFPELVIGGVGSTA